ncbi:MAG: GNAT family N-acetyltransferase [Ferruginibacter sp.]
MLILETERLTLREFKASDAAFIVVLLNTPTWIRFIGDRGIRNVYDASLYLQNGPIKSYQVNGFGLWLVSLKEKNRPIGMCGIIRREELDHPDIGFALLPEFAGQGYGFEIASATMSYAKHYLQLDKIVGITTPDNEYSIKLLQKLGLKFEKHIKLPAQEETLMLFS